MEFEELGTRNLDLGVALHDAIGGLADKTPNDIMQIQEVADFFNDFPDAIDTLKRVARSNNNPNIKNLEHITAFMLLNKKKLEVMDSLDNINNELKYYG